MSALTDKYYSIVQAYCTIYDCVFHELAKINGGRRWLTSEWDEEGKKKKEKRSVTCLGLGLYRNNT